MATFGSMAWATRVRDGTVVHVTEVRTGLACGCVCPGCGVVLEAVNSENPAWRIRPHFRHDKGSELKGCATDGVVAAARAVLGDVEEFLLPAMDITAEAVSPDGRVFCETVAEAERVAPVAGIEFVDQTEAVLTLADGQQVLVCLVATSTEAARRMEAGASLAEVIVDVSDPVLRTADRETLRRHIALSPVGRMGCHQQREAELREAAQRLASRKAAGYWEARQQRFDSFSPLAVDRRFRAPSPGAVLQMPGPAAGRKPAELAWSTGPLPTDRATAIQRVRLLYRNGAFRLHGVRIDYDDVSAAARQARAAGESLQGFLAAQDVRWRLFGDLKSITDFLVAGGSAVRAVLDRAS